MKIKSLHKWDVTIEEARNIQLELKEKIRLQKLTDRVEFIAGADVSYSRKANLCFAVVTIFKFPEMEIIEQTKSTGPIVFPYVPGYLTFREAPTLLNAFEKVTNNLDLVLFDGQGIAHPRQMGIAAHLGLILDVPSIGCAKSPLVGKFNELSAAKGSWTELIYQNKVIGAVVRTRGGVKPVFVSPGHKITINEAMDWVLKTCTEYRIPEPIRQSHLAVNQLRAGYEKQF